MLGLLEVLYRIFFIIGFLGVLIYSIRTKTFIVYSSMKYKKPMRWYEAIMIYGGLILCFVIYAKIRVLEKLY